MAQIDNALNIDPVILALEVIRECSVFKVLMKTAGHGGFPSAAAADYCQDLLPWIIQKSDGLLGLNMTILEIIFRNIRG